MQYSIGCGTERIVQVPIVSVAHSMGGLVFKEAFISGQVTDEFSPLVSKIKAVVFPATPHRGSSFAETLSKVLASSVFGHTPKDYVAEAASVRSRRPQPHDLRDQGISGHVRPRRRDEVEVGAGR
jgi:hypothetical protein